MTNASVINSKTRRQSSTTHISSLQQVSALPLISSAGSHLQSHIDLQVPITRRKSEECAFIMASQKYGTTCLACHN